MVAACFRAKLTPLREPGALCTDDTECFGGACLDATCRTWCRGDFDCEGSGTCETGLGYYVKTGDEVGLCTSGDENAEN
jgi:hypothetical protein